MRTALVPQHDTSATRDALAALNGATLAARLLDWAAQLVRRPAYQPDKFDVTLDRGTAASLALDLARASKIIEGNDP